uniref:Uncharacterized protein n=1 Tax=Pyrodinium bahamense TaxID=73915 RepID=A0A7S0B3H3_9DINO
MAELVQRRGSHPAVLTFSHFLPCLQVNPEKRYLYQPMLAKAVGSTYLKERVEKLRPDMHIFGHTHLGFDMVVDGVRFLQAPLAYPTERDARATTVAVGQFPIQDPRPCLVWDSIAGWVPPYRGAWSEYYIRYGRCPEVTNILPAYVAANLTPVSRHCRVGWIRGRMPAWLFGPLAHRLTETRRVVDGVHQLMAGLHKLDAALRPQTVEVGEFRELLAEGRCTVVDVRADAACPRDGVRIPGGIALPHPALTETFPQLPDEELLELCEQLLARDGPLILVGSGPGSCLEPAILLAHLLRLFPADLKTLRGGSRAMVGQG